MTDEELIECARKIIRAENAAYMREWRKKNPDREKAIREKCKQNKLKKYIKEVQKNGY